MNRDDFETKLRRQPLRPVPPEWRAEILHTARQSVRPTRPAPSAPGLFCCAAWREWLWPCPAAWAGVAAAWLVILGLNLGVSDPPKVALNPLIMAPNTILKIRQEQQQFLAGLQDPSEAEPVRPARPFVPKPSSARRTSSLFV
jgi:hypothetical protein